jgi:hypothetical protein
MTSTAVDLGEPGRDSLFGFGRIDPVAALAAEAPLPNHAALLHGAVWYDDNHNNIREAEEGFGVEGLRIAVQDSQQHPVGLANTRANGDWQWLAPAAGQYTITARLPYTLVPTARGLFSVTVGSSAPAAPLNFGVTALPTSADFQSFDAIRLQRQVYLSWRVTSAVRTVQLERAAAIDGTYAVVGSLPSNTLGAAATPVSFVDPLPNDLQGSALYYRVKLYPGDLVIGPFLVGNGPEEHELFLPLIRSR